MPKQEYKILEFHGGTNNKFDPRDIAENQNSFSQLSISNPGRLALEGSAMTLYDKTSINPLTVTDVSSSTPGFVAGYGLFSFSHDYDLDPSEVDTDFIVSNDKTSINIYDPNKSGGAGWYSLNGGNAKFTLGSRDAASYPVKPVYYNVDGALRACDSEFRSLAKISTGYLTNKDPHLKSDVALTIDTGSAAIAAGSTIQINNEIMYVTTGCGTSGTALTVIRGYANTKITQHANNSTIYYVNVPKFFGHIGGSDFKRLAECDTPINVNAWVEDVQTPQPPNNTRMGDGTTGVLASSAGVQSLRIYDSITSSTDNYPAEPEKVILEFDEAAADVGIKKIEFGTFDNGGNYKITTSGYGNSATGNNRLSKDDVVTLTDMQDTAVNLAAEYVVKFVADDGSYFTIYHEEGNVLTDASSGGTSADWTGSGFTTAISDWESHSGEGGFEQGIKIVGGETDFTNAKFANTLPIHITGETGITGYNGIYTAYNITDDNNRIYIKHPLYASFGTGGSAGSVQQLLGVVKPEEGKGSINPDLKRKWNFAMSFTYDGPAQEVQESLLTPGYKIYQSLTASGNVNTLDQALDNSETNDILVDDVTVFTDDVTVIMVDDEQMLVTNIDTVSNPDDIHVVRGYNGSAKDTHDDDAPIYIVEELTPLQTVDWTNFQGVPRCIIKSMYAHGTDNKTWNPRINGFKIYMKDVTEENAGDDWRLFSHVNFNKGTYTIFAAGDSELILEQPASGNIATNTTGTELNIKPVDTYLSENLFTEDTIIDAQYQCAEVVGRRVYIGNIKQGDRTYPDRMLRTPINKFDTFPETNYIDVVTGDGDSIIALKSFGDRLLQFKRNAVYVINVSGEAEVLEAEYHGNGIKYPSQVVKTNLGIAWINDAGLWFFDGKSATNLTLFLEDDGYSVGTSPISGAKLGYDKKTNRLIYAPRVLTGLATAWYIYDIDLKAYQAYYLGNLFPYSESSSNVYTNFINDKEGNLIVGYVDYAVNTELNFYKWDSGNKGHHSTGTNIFHQTKDIDLGSPGVKKKIYKVYITYKCTGHSGMKALYATDGNTPGVHDPPNFTGTFKDSDNYKSGSGGFQDSSGDWKVAELKPSSSINNIYSFQLSIDAIGGGGTVVSGDATTVRLASGLGSTDYDEYNLYLYAGPARYNSRRITSYDPSNQTATVSALTDNGYGNSPDNTTKYILPAMASDFEINDITIIFKGKPVK